MLKFTRCLKSLFIIAGVHRSVNKMRLYVIELIHETATIIVKVGMMNVTEQQAAMI